MATPPENSQPGPQLTPLLSVRRGAEAIEFYKAAFGVREQFRIDGDNGDVIATLGDGNFTFWVSDESPEHENFSPAALGGSTVRLILTVADPDVTFARAIAAGAREVWPVADQHGWRIGRVADPFGHHWEIAKPLA